MGSSAQTQLENDTNPKQIIGKKGYDSGLKKLKISDNISIEFLDLLVACMNNAYTMNNNVLRLADFTLYLSNRPEVSSYLKTENIDILKLINNLSKSSFTGNESKDIVVIEPQLTQKIIETYQYGVNIHEPNITPLLFIKCLIAKSSSKQVNVLNADLPNLSKLVAILNTDQNDEITGREEEANIITRTLLKPDRNNIILIGEQGIGKTFIVKRFLNQIKSNPELAKQFEDYSILSVDLPELLSIAQYREEQFNSLLNEIGNTKNRIFYFPNMDLKAISKDGLAIEYIFSTFTKDPSNKIIVGCSYNTYQSILNKIDFFVKNFETLNVEEVSEDDLKTIINNRIEKIKKERQYEFSEFFISDLIDLSRRFIPTKMFPDKALNLIEEICVNAKMKKLTIITSDEIKEVLAQKTGIPIQTLSISEKETLMNLESEMAKVLIGQGLAVKSVVQSIQRSRVGLKNPNKPVGSFLFLGPTGVGKTECAKQLARIYYRDEKAFMRFDMSEYSESHTNQKLIGAPPGYAGYDEGGTLTNYVMQRPYSLLLFDEVEKAHPKTYDLFLQILDEGRLTDAKGHLVDFKNTILIFTSNIGSEDIALESANPNSLLFTSSKEYFDKNILPKLSEYLRIEFINRFDEIIPFLPLNEEQIFEILLLKIAKIRTNIEKQGFVINYDDAELKKLAALSYDPKFGAREIDRVLKKYFENPIASNMLNLQEGQPKIINWKLTIND